jgi:REP-associated tyrosine transposase
MPRRRRIAPGGVVYHVCNRGSRKGELFRCSAEYSEFTQLTAEARTIRPMRIIAYCLMPNHWHFLLWPEKNGQLSRFMHWLTTTHATRWRGQSRTTGEGAVYQSRFTAVPVHHPFELVRVWRYVERNPIEARLVSRAEQWPWSSAAQLSERSPSLPVDSPPMPRPPLPLVNSAELRLDAKYASVVRDACAMLTQESG